MKALARFAVCTSIVTFLASVGPKAARADEWYGAQNLAFDGVALGLATTAVFTPRTPRKVLLGLSLGTYLVASPVIHGAHERPAIAVAALGLRIGMPLALGIVGLGIGAADGQGFEGVGTALVGGVLGVALGALTAMLIDDAALARRESVGTAQGTSALAVGHAFYVPWGTTF